MRFARIIPFLLVAAAGCGDDNSNTRRDAAPQRDSSPDDGDVDDAPPDGPPSGGPRVWVVGDFLTNNHRNAGSFPTGATLPFNPTTPPPVVIPGGTTAEIFFETSTTFHTNGTKIVYVADATVPDRNDIYVANGDGSNPVLVIEGPAVPQTQEFPAVVLSPDGTKVAYLHDATTDGVYDLYVAPTTASATGVKVSPDRVGTPAANQDVQSAFSWSPDSKYLAFSGDIDTLDYNEVFVVDTSVASPTRAVILTRAEITATGRGLSGVLLFDAQSNVFFRAKIDDTAFKLFKSSPTDGTTKTIVTLPMRGDATTPDVGTFGITPDGSKIVYSADAPTAAAYDLYVANTATPNANTKLTNLTGPGAVSFFSTVSFSPDGTKVAVVADFAADNVQEPSVIHLDGSATRRLVAVPGTCAGCDANIVQFDPDGTTVWAMGDFLVDNDTQVYKLDSTMTDQTPTLAVDVPVGGDLVNLFVIP